MISLKNTLEAIKTKLNAHDASINNLETYSTSETIVGVWTDGKPLYRKVLTYTNSGSIANGNYTSAHGIANVDMIMWTRAILKENGSIIPIPNTNFNIGGSLVPYINKTDFGFRNYGDTFRNLTITAVVEYTKTTD